MRGKTIFRSDFAQCKGCDRFSENKLDTGLPNISLNSEQIISKQTAYQITILNGVITRGTGKKIKRFKCAFSWKNRDNK